MWILFYALKHTHELTYERVGSSLRPKTCLPIRYSLLRPMNEHGGKRKSWQSVRALSHVLKKFSSSVNTFHFDSKYYATTCLKQWGTYIKIQAEFHISEAHREWNTALLEPVIIPWSVLCPCKVKKKKMQEEPVTPNNR